MYTLRLSKAPALVASAGTRAGKADLWKDDAGAAGAGLVGDAGAEFFPYVSLTMSVEGK